MPRRPAKRSLLWSTEPAQSQPAAAVSTKVQPIQIPLQKLLSWMIEDTKTPNQPELTGVFDGTAIKKACTASIQPFGSGKEYSIAPSAARYSGSRSLNDFHLEPNRHPYLECLLRQLTLSPTSRNVFSAGYSYHCASINFVPSISNRRPPCQVPLQKSGKRPILPLGKPIGLDSLNNSRPRIFFRPIIDNFLFF